MKYQINDFNIGKNRTFLIIIAFLCYFFTGSLVTITGVILSPAAKLFDVDISDISYIYTYQNGAMWIILLLSGFLMKNISLKSLIIISIILEIIAISILSVFTEISSFSLFMFFIGVCGGIFMAVGSYLLVSIFTNYKERSKKMITADMFFSIAGVIIPFMAAKIITSYISRFPEVWIYIYYFISVVGIIMLLLAIFVKFPCVKTEQLVNKNNNVKQEKWGMSIWAVCICALFFIAGELGFVTWMPTYLESELGWSALSSSNLITVFWLSMAIGLFCGQYYIKLFKLRNSILTTLIISVISLGIGVFSHNFYIIFIAFAILGFFNSVIYASFITFASLQVKISPPTLVATVLTFGTTGTFLSSIIPAFVEEKTGDIHLAIISAFLLYIICLIFFVFAYLGDRIEKIHSP